MTFYDYIDQRHQQVGSGHVRSSSLYQYGHWLYFITTPLTEINSFHSWGPPDLDGLGYRTVLAYNNPGYSRRVLQVSNPDVLYKGLSEGFSWQISISILLSVQIIPLEWGRRQTMPELSRRTDFWWQTLATSQNDVEISIGWMLSFDSRIRISIKSFYNYWEAPSVAKQHDGLGKYLSIFEWQLNRRKQF